MTERQNLPAIKSVALISPNDQSGVDTSKAGEEAAKKVGWTVAANEGYERGTQEFTSLLTRVLAKKPDIIDLSGSATGDGALILKQLKGLGYAGKLTWSSMQDPVPILKTTGDAAEGTYALLAWDLKSAQSVPTLRDFATRYQARFNDAAGMSSAVQYATFQVVEQAMTAAKSVDPAVVVDQIAKTGKFETVLGSTIIGGETLYGLKRQFLFPAVITQVKSGASVPLELVTPAPQ